MNFLIYSTNVKDAIADLNSDDNDEKQLMRLFWKKQKHTVIYLDYDIRFNKVLQ